MPAQAPVEPLIALVPAPEHGPDVFANVNLPWTPGQGVRGIFGGFLIGQAVRAAQLTAPESFSVHALQSVFVRPGQATSRFVWRVERVSDGRTFATRLVRAEQEGRCVYVATVGLHRVASSSSSARDGGGGGGGGDGRKDLEDAIEAPDMAGIAPDDIPLTSNRDFLVMVGLLNPAVDSAVHDPFEWRHILPNTTTASEQQQQESNKAKKPSDFRLRSYVRSQPLSPAADRATHTAALAFLTDEWLIATVNLAHPPSAEEGKSRSRFSVQASMNHSVLFHEPAARADEWLVSERSTSWAADGRVLVEQRFWSRSTGRLVLSCWQEGLVRLNRAARDGNKASL